MRKIIFILLFLASAIIVSIAVLEILSGNHRCQNSKRPSIEDICVSREAFILPQTSQDLEDIKAKRISGEKISKDEYSRLMNEFIFEVPPERLAGYYNGIACGNYGYIRNDMPEAAKMFVKRHELEHLLQIGRERNGEFPATMAGLKEYPFGFLEAVFFTLRNRAQYSESSVCYLVSSWKTFKIYLLP